MRGELNKSMHSLETEAGVSGDRSVPFADHFRQLEADFQKAIVAAQSAVARFEETLATCETTADLQDRFPGYTLAGLRGRAFPLQDLLSDRTRTVNQYARGKAEYCGADLKAAASRLVLDAVEQKHLLRPLRLCRESVPRFRSENRGEDEDDFKNFWREVLETLKEEFSTHFDTTGPDLWQAPRENCSACWHLAVLTTPVEGRRSAIPKRKRGEAVMAALVVLSKNPKWSVEQIAKEVGCAHTTLYRNSTFMRGFEMQSASSPPPKGYRVQSEEDNLGRDVEARSED